MINNSTELTEEFNKLLSEYQNTSTQFITSLESSQNNLAQFQNFNVIGGTNLSQSSVSSAQDCLTNCSNTDNCNSAIYNETNNNCTLLEGEGSISPQQNSIAIVKESIYYNYKLQQLNSRLREINNQLMQNTSKLEMQYTTDKQDNSIKSENLNINKSILETERQSLDAIMMELNAIDQMNEQGSINVTMNYYNYIVLTFIAILLVGLLLRFSISPIKKGGSRK
jgi:hypothetical protein